MTDGSRHENRLARESSPYLLQHARNPVDWYPWGEEALARARAEDRPILLSVGYAACHWCHVMERESFEDPATAARMNALYVNVKVDREERPDVDALYMEATIGLTGQGGWPMTVFLTPDGRPFYAGTYFPPTPRGGLPAFAQVLDGVARAYRERRDEIERVAGELAAALRAGAAREPTGGVEEGLLDAAIEVLERQQDREHGGFGGAPKFPPSSLVASLVALRGRARGHEAEAMARRTLDAMAAGGIHDHLGGGFHRYAVDRIWLVPHFEKMLYDNAQLADAYAAAAAALDEPRYADVALGALAYMDGELSVPGGGLASSHDADTDGHEGLTFVWTPAEVEAAVGDPLDARVACGVLGVAPGGSFEGATVLSRVAAPADVATAAGLPAAEGEERLARALARMAEARRARPQPARDDKAVAAWNGLALAAFANAGRLLGRPDLVERARALAGFLLGPLSTPDGGLLRSVREGAGRVPGFADDYGSACDGLLALHLATGELAWLDEARRLAALALPRFHDPERGGFFLAPADGERLVARTKDLDDNPAPSGSSQLAWALARLGRIYDEPAWEEAAASAVRLAAGSIARAPQAFGRLLQVVHLLAAPPREIAIVGAAGDPARAALVDVLRARAGAPEVAVVADPADPLLPTVPLLAGRVPPASGAAAWVCERFACGLPATSPAALAAQLGA